jgi:hypothetical protein
VWKENKGIGRIINKKIKENLKIAIMEDTLEHKRSRWYGDVSNKRTETPEEDSKHENNSKIEIKRRTVD